MLLLPASAAHAQTATSASASGASAADALFAEGRDLVDAKRYSEAIAKFSESQKLDPGVGTLLNLAYCYEQIGKTGTAWSTYRAAAAAAREQADAEREQFANERAVRLQGSLAYLTVQLPPSGEPDDLAITLDGAVLPRNTWGTASPIDPGPHDVRATAEGHRPWSYTMEIQAGAGSAISIPVLEADAPPLRPAPERPPPRTARTIRWQDPVAATLAGAGAVSLGIGLAFTLAARSQYDGSSSHCNAHNGCDPMGLGARRTADSDADVATGTTIAGGTLVAGGLALWLLSPHDAPQHSGIVLLPAIGPSSAGVALHRVW
jgi:hypothetical protein